MIDVKNVCSKIFELQDSMNKMVNPAWKVAGYPWYRAAWTEAAELMDHVGLKWWKKQDFDQEQAKLELVDILHFMVADMIVAGYEYETLAASATSAHGRYTQCFDKEYALDAIDDFVEYVTMSRGITPKEFWPMVYALGFNYEEILLGYIGKNCLNTFRQNNGYKEGTYVKIWNGLEDNEVLTKLINVGYQSFDDLYLSLTAEYEKVAK